MFIQKFGKPRSCPDKKRRDLIAVAFQFVQCWVMSNINESDLIVFTVQLLQFRICTYVDRLQLVIGNIKIRKRFERTDIQACKLILCAVESF